MTERDTDVWPDNPKELLAWFLFASAVVGIYVWTAHPGLVDGAPADAGPPSGVEAPEGGLAIGVEDRDYLNRIYSEQRNEVVYCGVVEDGVLGISLATMVESTHRNASFRRDDCPPSPDGRVNVHTHPGHVAEMSAADEALLRRHGYRYVCIQSGAIEAAPGRGTEHLRCYTLDERGAVREVPVSVASG